MLDKQKVFTKVKNHLLKQNQKSFDPKIEKCAYRVEKDGKVFKCAIGCLIQKRNYSYKIEKIGIWELCESREERSKRKNPTSFKKLKLLKEILELELKTKLTTDDFQFLNQLQNIHDNHDPCQWKNELDDFAESNQLIFDN